MGKVSIPRSNRKRAKAPRNVFIGGGNQSLQSACAKKQLRSFLDNALSPEKTPILPDHSLALPMLQGACAVKQMEQ